MLYPETLASRAEEIANRHNYSITVLGEDKLRELGLNSHLAVGQGSARESCLIIVDTAPKSNKCPPPLALIGKGITFDSGGVSLKPAASMHEMKGDMSGAAVVLGVLDVLGNIGYSERIVCVIPAAENMGGSKAQRPGDIVKAFDGTYIEVMNTDAEGRMVLADAIGYVKKKYQPERIIDVATLTGSVFTALGKWAIGLFGTDEELVKVLTKAGERTYERTWRLPLFPEYSEQIKSDTADIKNVGGKGASSATAAAFLQHFAGKTPWVHLDIAGVAWFDSAHDYIPKGPTGIGVRLLVEALTKQL